MGYLGALAVAAQTILVRELLVSFYGTEFALAAALTCWLIFVPLGALACALVLRRVRRATGLLCVAAVAIGLCAPAQFVLARLVRAWLAVEPGGFVSIPHMLLSASLCAGPMSFLVGFFFPAACRHEAAASHDRAGGIRRIYVAEALGSCLGGALMSFVLLVFQTPTAIALALGAVWLLVAGVWLGTAARRWPLLVVPAVVWVLVGPLGEAGARTLGVVLCAESCVVLLALVRSPRRPVVSRRGSTVCVCAAYLLALVFLVGGADLRRWSLERRWRTFTRFELVDSLETRYQHVDLGRREGQMVVVQDGLRGDVFPDPYESREAAALLLTQHPSPRRVLIIGGGLGGLCQQVLAASAVDLDYVEMDPRLVALYRRHLPADLLAPLRERRFAAFACDGRRFVQAAASGGDALRRRTVSFRPGRVREAPRAPYDIVLINIGDPTSASSNRFYTVEFFREVSRVLAPDGVMGVWGIRGDENYLRGPLLSYNACHWATMRRVFPRIVVRPGPEFCYFASAGAHVTADAEVLAARFDRLGLEPPEMRGMFAASQFLPERVRYVEGQLAAAAADVRVNSDDRPLAFTLFLRHWQYFSRQAHLEPGAPPAPERRGFFDVVLGVRPGWFVVPFAACLLVVLAVRGARGRRRSWAWSAGLCIVTTGMFGLSAEVLIIYAYQTHFGFVYRDISLLVGVFMLGLAAGAVLLGRTARSPAKVLVVLEVLQVLWLLALPAGMPVFVGSPWFFAALAVAAGVLTGGEFPLACRLGLDAGHETASVAGLFDAADHVGAVLGAALTGLVLMPAFGLASSSVLLACAKCASLLGLAATVGLLLRPPAQRGA